jgi:aminoglycoside phosphotransferase (APT) family kinase protein
VPKVYLLCTDDSVIGTPFFVMEFVRGRIFVDPSMPSETRAHRHACLLDVIRVLAAIHAVDFAAVGLSSYGKSGKFFERNVATLTHAANLQSQLAGPIPGEPCVVSRLQQHLLNCW